LILEIAPHARVATVRMRIRVSKEALQCLRTEHLSVLVLTLLIVHLKREVVDVNVLLVLRVLYV
jgi:hypothetical protein